MFVKCCRRASQKAQRYLRRAAVALLAFFQQAVAALGGADHVREGGLVDQTHPSSADDEGLEIFAAAAAEACGAAEASHV